MPNALIAAEALERHFGGTGWLHRARPIRAVAGIDLSIGRGEALGLVGESGSGKSTIGRLLLGMMSPTAGRIHFDGRELGKGRLPPALRRRMQLVFQDPYSSFDPRRTVGAQIADGPIIHHLRDRGAIPGRVEELLMQVGLDPAHAARYPHQFSGGQRQRLGIARALATEPDFLVADEPVSALDVSVQAQILALLADLRTRLNLALLFISHDLPVVRHLCDRVVVLYLGRVMEEGPAELLFRHPRHPYTVALISATPTLDGEKRERIILRNEPPSPAAPPSGCVFRTRCTHALAMCAETVPPLREVDGGGRVACLRDDVTGA